MTTVSKVALEMKPIAERVIAILEMRLRRAAFDQRSNSSR